MDTGSTHAAAPLSLLERLEIIPGSLGRYKLAVNRMVKCGTGYARIRYGGDEAVVPVISGREDIAAGIGATAPESLGIAVDSLEQTLVPVEGLMRRQVQNIGGS